MASDILFPTSVIGSLPRPQFVKDLIADDCPIQGEEYRRLMGNAVREQPSPCKKPRAWMSLPMASGGEKATSG